MRSAARASHQQKHTGSVQGTFVLSRLWKIHSINWLAITLLQTEEKIDSKMKDLNQSTKQINSLSRREESCKNELFACLHVRRVKKTFSIKVRLYTTVSSQEWPIGGRSTTNCELSPTIHIEEFNREFRHSHLRTNDYRWHT